MKDNVDGGHKENWAGIEHRKQRRGIRVKSEGAKGGIASTYRIKIQGHESKMLHGKDI